MRCHLPILLLLAQCHTAAQDGPRIGDVCTADGRTVATIVGKPHDPERHQTTSKVFHHVFAPDGRLLTKGTGGLYDHHRGLFLGWNQARWQGDHHDWWHCKRESQRFRRFLGPADDPLAPEWQVAAIEWYTAEGTIALDETRAIRARALGEDTTALDLMVDLRPRRGTLRLAGDPQHAGQQFRALQAFAPDDAVKVRYVRPATAAGHGNDVWNGCRWIAAVLPLTDGPVTVLRLEGARNPGPTTWSTRAYGRFGATFTHEIAAGDSLTARWTYVIALGARNAAWCEAMATTQSPAAERNSSTSR